jgi:hypothetical protein
MDTSDNFGSTDNNSFFNFNFPGLSEIDYYYDVESPESSLFSSEFSSPCDSPPEFPVETPIFEWRKEDVIPLEITLYQKKRGSGGVWQPIVQNERIRVDKIKGKLIKILINDSTNKISWNNVANVMLSLIDTNSNPVSEISETEGFTILPALPAKEEVPAGKEMKIKLTKICKNQCFIVSVLTKDGFMGQGSSIEFRSDDNGKAQNANKKRKREKSPDLKEVLRQGLKQYSEENIYSNDNELVNLIARSLVPVIIDNFINSGNLNQEINKRLKMTPDTCAPIKLESACA